MRTRSSRSTSPHRELVTIPRRRTRRHSAPKIETDIQIEPEPPVIMVEDRTMNELLKAPTEGYGDAIVVPAIVADNFELKTGLINLVTNRQFYGFERDDPQDHIRWFNKITSTIKCKNVLEEAIKLLLFPFSLDGASRIWLDKQPPRSIVTWEDLVKKYVNEFFPPSKTTSLRNEIMKFTHNFDESFSESWDRFKEMLRKCPHHGFSELMQLDTFYNGVSQADQDSLNSSAGGNFLNRTTKDALAIIENKSKVRTTRSKPIVSQVSVSPSTSSPVSHSRSDNQIDRLTEAIHALVFTKQKKVSSPQTSSHAEVKKIEVCVTCGGPHAYYNCTATDGSPFEVNALVGTFNQGGNQYRPQVESNYRASNQSGPPGFSQPSNPNRFNHNQQIGQNTNNQYHAPNNQYSPQKGNSNQGYSAPTYQGPPSNELANHIKTNEVSLRAMQNQISHMKNEFQSSITKQGHEMRNELTQSQNKIENMLAGIMNHLNPASTSGGLPSKTVANPKGELKAITTRSGVAYDGPTIPTTSTSFPSKVVETEPEANKDEVLPTNNGGTQDVPPQVVPKPKAKPQVVFEPHEIPVETPKSKPSKPTIPYPSRLTEQKLREKASHQMDKFFQNFQELHFDISFADAIILMPKFASTIKHLLSNKKNCLKWQKLH